MAESRKMRRMQRQLEAKNERLSQIQGQAGSLGMGALAHEAASMTSPQMASWMPFPGSADADLLLEQPIMVSRTRDLARNNGIASGALQTLIDNVVGTGLRLHATPNWAALGKPPEWGDDISRRAEALWNAVANSTAIDAAREFNFGGLTTQMFISWFHSGEGLALPIWEPEAGDQCCTRISVIEPDQLCNPNMAPDTRYLRGGRVVNQYNRPLSYWVRTTHPGDVFSMSSSPPEWENIPAQTSWGRKRVIHYREPSRPGQSRGKPLLAAVMPQFKQMDRYSAAEMDAALVNALIAAIVETPMDTEGLLSLLGTAAPGQAGGMLAAMAQFNARAGHRAKLKSGSIISLYPGEKISSFNPGRPSTSFGPFMEVTLKHLATGLNMPYELLMKDFSKTNYSSARAALIEVWRYFRGLRHGLSNYWASPVYALFFEEWVNAGLLPITPDEYYSNPRAYTAAQWIGAGKGWVDPVKEAQAAVLRMDGGFSTLQAECAEQGLDWQEVLRQQACENRFRREQGLMPRAANAPLFGVQPGEDASNDDQKPPDTPETDGDQTD